MHVRERPVAGAAPLSLAARQLGSARQTSASSRANVVDEERLATSGFSQMSTIDDTFDTARPHRFASRPHAHPRRDLARHG